MNRTLRLIAGIAAVIIGSKYLIDAVFIGESVDWMDAVITRSIYLVLGLSLIGFGYYFGIRKKEVTKKMV